MWRKETIAKKGRPPENGSNRTIKPIRGTTKAYTLERLNRELYPTCLNKV
jgi:hypothetical protein